MGGWGVRWGLAGGNLRGGGFRIRYQGPAEKHDVDFDSSALTGNVYTLSTWLLESKKGLDDFSSNPLNFLAPRPGLEPGTCGLTESQARVKLSIFNGL